jgi:hypothetical protein
MEAMKGTASKALGETLLAIFAAAFSSHNL